MPKTLRTQAMKYTAMASIAVLGLLLAACDEGGAARYPARKRMPGTAKLPDTPELNPKLAPAQFEDGAWSIRGSLESGVAGRGDTSIDVRGFIAEIHVCEDPDKGCRPAPHLLLTDREDLQGRRMLVGGPIIAGQRDAAGTVLVKGKATTVRGKIIRTSADGAYFAPGGLLFLDPPEPPAAVEAP